VAAPTRTSGRRPPDRYRRRSCRGPPSRQGCRAVPSWQWPLSERARCRRVDGLTTDDGGWRGDPRHTGQDGAGQRRVRGGPAATGRVAGPDAAEDLPQPLERGDRPGGQEVVDIREGSTHATGEGLVA